nr:hypothetical protein [Tanacetum cinerariifolium]
MNFLSASLTTRITKQARIICLRFCQRKYLTLLLRIMHPKSAPLTQAAIRRMIKDNVDAAIATERASECAEGKKVWFAAATLQGPALTWWNAKVAQLVQNDGNEVGQNAVQNPAIQIVENMNGLSVVLEITNRYRNRNVVIALAEGNGNGINGNLIRCYNCQGKGHYASNYTVKPRKRGAAYIQQQL